MNKIQVFGRVEEVKGKIRRITGTMAASKTAERKRQGPGDCGESRGGFWGSKERPEEWEMTWSRQKKAFQEIVV